MHYELIVKVVNELSTLMAGARVTKIYQPAESLIVIKFWNGRATCRLLLCADQKNYRLHITEQEYLNPSTPPRFCQLLRSRLAKIVSVDILNEDRVVRISGSGKHGCCSLIIELTGKASNMILVDADGIIIDCLKRSKSDGDNRACLAGVLYALPDKGKLNEGLVKKSFNSEPESGSWNQCVDKIYINGIADNSNKDLKQQLKQTVDRQIKKLKKRAANISSELDKQKNADQLKQFGELILANVHQIKRGEESVGLVDYYAEPPETVDVKLDRLLSPQQNAEKYFHRYKKLKKGLIHSQRRFDETTSELEWIRQLEYQLDDSVKKSDIEEIAQELREAGLLKEKNRLHQRRTQHESKPFEAISPSGFKVFWGRNNRQNDTLSTRILKSGDLWFHAYQCPGTHVVLKSNGGRRLYSDEDKNFAAAIAAGYSKRKNDSRVEVILAEAEAVKKPKNSRPGLVTVQKYRTLLVEPLRIEN